MAISHFKRKAQNELLEYPPPQKRLEVEETLNEKLPPEMLYMIFKQLSIIALKAASSVCQSWNSVANPAEANGFYWKRVVDLKLGQRAFYYLDTLIESGKITWQEVALWFTPSFLDFLDKTSALKMMRQEKMLEISFKEEEENQLGTLAVAQLHPPLIAGRWLFRISDSHSILILDQVTNQIEVFRAEETISFTHLAYEEYLFALTADGRIYQINCAKNELVQVLETSFYEKQKEEEGNPKPFKLRKENSKFFAPFLVQKGKVILCLPYDQFEIIDYIKPDFKNSYAHHPRQNNSAQLFHGSHLYFLSFNDGSYTHRLEQYDFNHQMSTRTYNFGLYCQGELTAFTIHKNIMLFCHHDEITKCKLKSNDQLMKCADRELFDKKTGLQGHVHAMANAEDLVVLYNILSEGNEKHHHIVFMDQDTLKPISVHNVFSNTKSVSLPILILETFIELQRPKKGVVDWQCKSVYIQRPEESESELSDTDGI